MKGVVTCALAAGLFRCLFASPASEQDIVAHESATVTWLQSEDGESIGGINIADPATSESLYKIAPGSLLPVTEKGDTTADEARCHTQVTMRIERAEVNFYLGRDFIPRIDV